MALLMETTRTKYNSPFCLSAFFFLHHDSLWSVCLLLRLHVHAVYFLFAMTIMTSCFDHRNFGKPLLCTCCPSNTLAPRSSHVVPVSVYCHCSGGYHVMFASVEKNWRCGLRKQRYSNFYILTGSAVIEWRSESEKFSRSWSIPGSPRGGHPSSG